MKVVNQRSKHSYKHVGNCKAGATVQFNKQFCQDYPPNDLYLVLDVCSSYDYRTSTGFLSNKIGIANLATGKLSFVNPDREVTIMNAEVNVDGPAT